MKRMNWFLAWFIFCVVLSAIVFVVPMESEAKTTVLRIGHEMPENHPYHLGALKFGEILKEKTNGRMEVKIYPNGQLGTQKELAEMVAANQVDVCLVWQGILESYDPNTGVVSLPFIFDSWEHTWKVIDGEVGRDILLH